jgi:dienelactone hydrolase
VGTKRITGAALVLAIAVAATASCSASVITATPRIAAPGPAPAAVPVAAAPLQCAVGLRTLALGRGTDRPLRTLIFYPATRAPTGPTGAAAGRTAVQLGRAGVQPGQAGVQPGQAGVQPGQAGVQPGQAGPDKARRKGPDKAAAASGRAGGTRVRGTAGCGSGGRNLLTNAAPAVGRYPLVLFSHGLRGSPQRYTATMASWAAAGFVVAAPSYPHTALGATRYDRTDIVNQPHDAGYVIKQVRRLDRAAGDPLAGHINVDRVAAVGHSAGGYTTVGLFVARHPTWLRAGVVIAGWLAPGAFAGPPATMLFLQGDRDTVVPPARERAVYDAVPWAKSYVLLPDSWHADYMMPGGRAYPLMNATVTDFLRWTLDNDEAARLRLPPNRSPGAAE